MEKRYYRFAFLSQVWPEDRDVKVTGSSVQVYYLAQELAKRGHHVLVILSSHSNYNVKKKNLNVISVESGKFLIDKLNPLWLKKVVNILKEFQPDIVYQRGKLPESVAAAYYKKRFSACFFWVSNSNMSGEHWKFLKKRWEKRKSDRFLLVPKLIEAFYADCLIELAIKSADMFLAQTKYQKETLKRNFGLNAILLGSGHPVPDYHEKNNQRPNILWLANITPVKQPHIFIKLAQQLRYMDADFIMAGRGANSKILREIKEINSKVPVFQYLGGVALDNGNELFKKADIFISTSSYEGIPNTFIQACLNATPIVSLRNDPNHIIQTEKIGAVVETFEEMKDTVRKWIQRRDIYQQAGRRAYEFAKKEFDIVNIVDRLLELVDIKMYKRKIYNQ